MLMQMIDCLIEQDPSLSARRAIDVRRYIVNQWNRTHEESIDEDGVALFLCDENRGTLTDEQRIFAKECREEIKACYYWMKRILKEAGLPAIRFHDLRHPYVKHTTKKYNSEKQKTQATKMDLIAWVFRFYTFNYSKRSWIL